VAFGANTYDAMEQFVMGKKKHKQECFEFKKSTNAEEFDLMKRQHNECSDLELRGLEKLRTQGFSEQLLRDCLAEQVALCARHMEEWKTLCDNQHMRGEDLYRNGKRMLEQFKQTYTSGTGYSYKAESPVAKSETFLEKALDMLKGNMPNV